MVLIFRESNLVFDDSWQLFGLFHPVGYQTQCGHFADKSFLLVGFFQCFQKVFGLALGKLDDCINAGFSSSSEYSTLCP